MKANCKNIEYYGDKDQTFENIADTIKRIDKASRGELMFLLGPVKSARARKLSLKQIHQLVYESIKFSEDKNDQVVKGPYCLVKDGVGDCKSFAIIVAHFLDMKGIKSHFVLVDQSSNLKHIYNETEDGTVIDSTRKEFDKHTKGKRKKIERLS